METLGELLQEKCNKKGVRKTAREIGISHSTLLRAERGLGLSLKNYLKICDWLMKEVNDEQ